MEKERLEMQAKLQQKKNKLRKMLAKKGVLQKDKSNTYDNYKYFSEASYKKLFTELFSEIGLELTTSIEEVERYSLEGKQPNGRIVKMAIMLSDIDTGHYETTVVYGEGIDKGDKAMYKAYTGAIKYYLADTFLVATGDDPEKESPEGKETVEYDNEEVKLGHEASFLDEYFFKHQDELQQFLTKYKGKTIQEVVKKTDKKVLDTIISNIKAKEIKASIYSQEESF